MWLVTWTLAATWLLPARPDDARPDDARPATTPLLTPETA